MNAPLMQFLKEETRSRHADAESHPFQGALANGRLPFEKYCLYLKYLYLLHQGFEQRLAEAAGSSGDISAVVKSEHYQMPYLLEDLQFLGIEHLESVNSPAINGFIKMPVLIEVPVSLLGVLYVLLGSKHGSKFIAHNVKESYKLGSGGYRYFDPYGPEFRSIWQNFIASMNNLDLDNVQRQAVLEAAGATFAVFGQMGAEILNDRESTPARV